MCTATQSASRRCQLLFQESETILQDYTWKAMHDREMHNSTFVVYCIFVDSQWKDLANFLSPGINWQLRRDDGFDPIATGFVPWREFEMALTCYPSLEAVQTSKLEDGMARYVVLHDNEPFVGDILAFSKQALLTIN